MCRVVDSRECFETRAVMIWLWMIMAIFLFLKLPKQLQTYLTNYLFAAFSWPNVKNNGKLASKNSTRDSQRSVSVLHYSKNFLILEKPYDMVINSNDDENKYTLQTEIRRLFPTLVNPKLRHEFHFVHRLDFATSGVICIALTKPSAREASAAFEKRLAKKYYLALVHGHVEKDSMVIEKAVGEDSREKDGNRKMCTDDDSGCERPRECRTALLVLGRGLRNGRPATKVLLKPGTGRRHQLRVHCLHIGHTIIGDYTYSKRKDCEPHRTFLHSFRLIIDNEIERLDVRTHDPFTELDSRNQWIPTSFIKTIDDHVFSEIDKLL